MIVSILVVVWIASNVVCFQLAKSRGVKPGMAMCFVGAILGPLAIPMVYALKQKPEQMVS